MLLSWEEWDMLLELSDEHGLTVSSMMRQLLRRESAKLHKKVARAEGR